MISQRLNLYAIENWNSFSSKNYFDSEGMFFTVFISLPLVINCVFATVLLIVEASRLLAMVKQLENKTKNATESKKKK
jgi:hypothetical protein